jgi:hypothetical protein
VLKKENFGLRISIVNSQLSSMQATGIIMQLATISGKIYVFIVTLKIKL